MTAPTRPILRYHGGKWRLAPWLLGFFPWHRTYVEPYGGAASVLMQKAPAYAEVYNDLDGKIVEVFRVLRDPALAAQVQARLALTPFARDEFELAYGETDDPVERVCRTVVLAFMGFGSGAVSRGQRTGFRCNMSRRGTTPAHDWSRWPAQVTAFCERLQGVAIENVPAFDLIPRLDEPDALFYVDPPYVRGTRSAQGKGYRFEMTEDDHRQLAAVLHAVEGMVVLSGYPCALYDDELYPTWERHERAHWADGARDRVEVVWLNPACTEALQRQRSQLELA